jgi:hypothetical protein
MNELIDQSFNELIDESLNELIDDEWLDEFDSKRSSLNHWLI